MTQIKYVLTFKPNKETPRQMAHNNDGRATFLTKKEVFNWLRFMYKNNSIDSIKQVFGVKPRFKASQTICYSNGDSCRTVFND